MVLCAAVTKSSDIYAKNSKCSYPVNLVVTAMALFKLGDTDKTREELGQLRALMADPANAETVAKDADAQAFLKEAEELIEPADFGK